MSDFKIGDTVYYKNLMCEIAAFVSDSSYTANQSQFALLTYGKDGNITQFVVSTFLLIPETDKEKWLTIF